MEETTNHSIARRCAVVTGANKGIGLEICHQLASNGISVILTARDDKRGSEAVESLKIRDSAGGLSVSDLVVYHQLDVKDPASIDSLAKFIEAQFTKLDILVNNAGISGLSINPEEYKAFKLGGGVINLDNVDVWEDFMKQTYETSQECIQTNYYGTKRVTEVLLPLLQLSDSPRIVNVSSFYGQLQFFRNKTVKSELENINTLTEEKIDEIILQFLRDFKEDKVQENGWPTDASAYKVSKAAINGYTRILARKFPKFRVNCVHPGYVQTDITFNTGNSTPEEGARAPVMLALLPDNGPSGLYFHQMCESTF